MNKPHKHCELIKAWADGAVIEWFYPVSRKWHIIHAPTWHKNDLYRIKPEPKKVYVRLWMNSMCLISSLHTKDKSKLSDNDYNWVSDWVEVELYSEDE